MTHRFRAQGELVSDFWGECLIVCPQCQKQALITYNPASWELDSGKAVGSDTKVRLICSFCGLAKEQAHGNYAISEARDPFFGNRLWLQTPVAGEVLWAYNEKHVLFLENYVAAGLREHDTGVANRSLASRLPKWIKSAKNREKILEGLARLRELL